MNTTELATIIYNHVNRLKRSGEHWDEWDDKREVEHIRWLIDNHHNITPNYGASGGGFQNSGENKTDGLSGFRG